MKKIILILVFVMFSIAALGNLAATYFISDQKITDILLNKAQIQAQLLAKNAVYIIKHKEDPLADLQEFVEELTERDDISYAIVIDSNVQAVAHSDIQKRNKVYKDEYTIEGATKGASQHSRWYAEVQKTWVFDVMAPIYINDKLYGTFDIGIPITEVTQAIYGIAVYQLAAILSIFVICMIVLSLILNKVLQPLLQLRDALENIAQGKGDLTVRLTAKGKNEIAQISLAFNKFVSKVHHIISQVVLSSVELNKSAQTLGEQAHTSLQRGQEQNTQAELITGSMSEMVTSVEQATSYAAKAADTANSVNDETQSGNKTVEKTSIAITNLETEMNNTSEIIDSLADKTQLIGSILEVIRGISEQTNLLALNAAIEAARAGEAGRGFAVVADEVRSLANKTAQSTDEIDSMISQLQTESKKAVDSMMHSKSLIQDSTTETEIARKALQVISEQMVKILDINTQLAAITEQQSSIAYKINTNTSKVNESVKTGLCASEELELSSKKLAKLSQELNSQVSSFQI